MFRLSAIVVLVACSMAPANAGFEYFVEFDQAVYNSTPGGNSVSVQIRLREETTGGDTPRLLAGGNDGLFQYDYKLDYSSFTGSQVDSSVTYASNNADFDGVGGFTNDPGVAFVAFDETTDLVNGVEVAGGGSSATILLGTATFLTGATSGSTTLQLSPDQVGTAEFVFIDFADNTSQTFNYGSATINYIAAVPEPSSAMLCGLAGSVLLLRRKRR